MTEEQVEAESAVTNGDHADPPKDIENEISDLPPDESPEENTDDNDEDVPALSVDTSSLQESQTPEGGIMLQNLKNGFASLRPSSPSRRKAVPMTPKEKELHIQSFATVNFIDPTANNAPSTPTNKLNQLFGSASKTPSTPAHHTMSQVDLYQKLSTILQDQFDSTLHAVPYENVRSGAPEVIKKLNVRPILTRAHGVSQDSYVAWGGTAGSAAPVSDPAEWHNTPYCHVYIAACESPDHYRTKVRPALQAFVSQIESAANAHNLPPGEQGAPPVGTPGSTHRNATNDSNGSGQVGNYSAQYVIVYVPIGKDNSSSGGANNAADSNSNRPMSLASRMRRQMQQAQQSIDDSSVHSNFNDDASVSSFRDDASVNSSSGVGSMSVSKAEKEMYRKFKTDFPNGKTCIMSTLLDKEGESNIPLRGQEWNSFLRMLGGAIVSGFKDRCRRYDEELRRLDARRATTASGRSKTGQKFDLSHFFLVKESLAFTYEQMQLPSEALLQYDELGAFVLEAASRKKAETDAQMKEEEDDYDGLSKRRSRSHKKLVSKRKKEEVEDEEAVHLAAAGDTNGFRRRIRATTDLVPMLFHVMQYLFARETSLLFLIQDPVEIVRRAQLFITTMYMMKMRGVMDTSGVKLTSEELRNREIEAEKWALSTCWDVKRACDSYFLKEELEDFNDSFVKRASNGQDIVDADSDSLHPDSKLPLSETRVPNPLDREVASKLSELLEFARLRLLRLGDSQLSSPNPIRTLNDGLPLDLAKPWEPWESITPATDTPIMSLPKSSESDNWLEDVFSSEKVFESKYLELTAAIVPLCQLAGSYRFAARLQAERAEIHIQLGEYHAATDILLPIVDICAEDQWDRGHFWRLFRLACCQRMIHDAPAYLNTLTRCFGSRLSPVAPVKTAELLQRDLEAVVGDEEISKYHLGVSPFLETELSVEALSAGKMIAPLMSMRRKVVKNFCSVGETAYFTLTITSHLPKPIHVESIRLFLVSFEKYETVYMNTPCEEDSFRVLPFDPPMVIEPGENKFKIEWIPMNTGQYILSAVEIRWKASCFFYRSCALRKPLMGIDVLPSEPTQTIELNPLFLIPGHVQPVRIVFHAGSDVITEGTVDLICSEGLQVIPPGADPNDEEWSQSCQVPLPPCSPGEKIVLETSVKSSGGKTENGTDAVIHDSDSRAGVVQTMQAKVATSYHHALYDKMKDQGESDSPCMKTVLEAMVTTLDRPALTVDSADGFSYTEDNVLVSVLLHCNTPVPFFIKEWDIRLPHPLRVEANGDMNEGLFGHPIAEGEQLSFGFKCAYDESIETKDEEPILHVVLQDEFGKTFNQVLGLNLDSIYGKLREKEEFTHTNAVGVELTCSSGEGLVGAPVALTYRVDASSVRRPTRRNSNDVNTSDEICMFYSVSSNQMEWVLAGNVEGILNCSKKTSFELEFIGIPTRPGVLKEFPSISLEYKSTHGDMPPITVHAKHPDNFKSLSFVNHMALACPAGIEA